MFYIPSWCKSCKNIQKNDISRWLFELQAKKESQILPSRVGIGYPKFGYPRVIPEPESNFGYGLGWVCVWNPWVFSGWVPIKFKILGFFGYYPRVPVRIGYPKFGHPRVIPKQYYYKKCSYIQRYKYYYGFF